MITKEKFKKGDFRVRENDLLKHSVAVFLKNNKNNAYTMKEIVRTTKRNAHTCRGMIRKLKKRKLVEHKSPYFMWR